MVFYVQLDRRANLRGTSARMSMYLGSANIVSEAPKGVQAVQDFARKMMGVKDVRVSPGLNQAIWARGVRSPPNRVRVRLERKRNDDEGAKEKLYVVASVVEGVTSFKGLETVVVEGDEE